MGTLAIDIETASPFKEPEDGENDTEFFEWLSVAVAYFEADQIKPETQVMFRQGGWDTEYTADLFDRLVQWCQSRDIERTLTYNGEWFDIKHMSNWAAALEVSGERPNASSKLQEALPKHVDVALAAADQYSHELLDGQVILPDWKVYDLENIDNQSIWYKDYSFNNDYIDGFGIDSKHVQGNHIGEVIGERYIDGVVAGLDQTKTHQELERLLRDYCLSDITDLYELYLNLGGESLIVDYHYPVEQHFQ